MGNRVQHFFRTMEADLPAHEEIGWLEWGRERVLSLPDDPVICLEWDNSKGEPRLPSDTAKIRPIENIPTDDCKICSPPIGASPTVREAAEWLADVAAVLYEKNAAYGDSASNPIRVFSRASATEQLLVRIDDKLSRIARGAGLLDDDEDVVRDLVGYLALLAVMKNKEP